MNNEKEIQNQLLAKIQLLVTTLDEMDEIFDKQSEEMQQADQLESDLDHIIENNIDITDDAKIAIFNKKNETRNIRRNWKNVHIIRDQYYQINDRLLHKNTRQFFVANMTKTINNLGQPYKNRVMNDEDVKELLNSKNIKKSDDKPKEKLKYRRVTKKELKGIIERYKEGAKPREIVAEFGIGLSNAYLIRKQYKDVIENE